jgi:predicted amidohydrolase
MSTHARIALLQLPAFSIEDAAASLAHTMRRIDETVAREKPDLLALPEVTYPAYFLGSDDISRHNVLSPADAATQFAAKAREHGVYIAVGLALDAPNGGYANGALLFDRNGEIAGRYDKSFLFHFDTRWFAPGEAYPVFETDIGRIGILICADGRLPEIARSLTLNGAQILLDLTAWVSTGRNVDDLSTPQREFLMPVRAAENGVWVAAADKCGIEAESIVYAGRSCFIDPSGRTVAELGPGEDAALVYDVPIIDAAPPVLRRPELYGTLAHPTESLSVTRKLAEAIVVGDNERRIAAVQITMPPTGEEFVRIARRHVERQALMDTDIVVFPATPSRLRAAYAHDAVLAGIQEIALATGVSVAFTVHEPDENGWRTMYLVGPRGVIAKHRQSHTPPGARFEAMPLGDAESPVVPTTAGRVGLMAAADGYAPEVGRSLMLRGAEILLWCHDNPGASMLAFARCRAEENRVFLACAGAPTEHGISAVIDPSGRVLAIALAERELAVSAEINRALSHQKQRAPGTDVVRNRQPATYGAIVEQAAAALGELTAPLRSSDADRLRAPMQQPAPRPVL